MIRRRRAAIVVAVIAGCAIATTARADAVPYPVRQVPLGAIADDTFYGYTSATPDGRYVLAVDCCGDQWRLDVTTGQSTPIDLGGGSGAFTLSDDGRYAYHADGDDIRRITVDGGAITDFTVPFTTDFDLMKVSDSDTSGRFLLLRGSSGGFAATRVFLYDSQLDQLVTPDPVGVSNAWNVEAISLSDDGRFVVYADYVVGAGFTSVVRWDRTTDERTTIQPPAGYDQNAGTWVVSPDLTWVLFPGSTAGIVPGLDGARRLYRRNLATGNTAAVPIAWDTIGRYTVTDGGRVIVEAEVVTTVFPDAPELFSWDGSGQALMLTRAPDGAPADYGVEAGGWSVNTGGTKVLFASFATNLAPPTVAPVRRLFEVTAPAIDTVNPSAIIAGNETYCLAAVGAAPGDFVGVNITPVFASSPGFGVLHSSDDPAGSTSNVNFGPSTVDPNVAFAKVGADGKICFTNSVHGPVHVIIDEMIVADAAAFRAPTAMGSARLADTRIGLGGPIVAASETRCLAAVGAAAGEFVGVNVLPVGATTPGFGTIHPGGTPAGPSSTANFGNGTFDPNFAFTEVGADGTICFTNSVHGPVHLILDELIVGSASAMSRPTPGPLSDRPVDTRVGVGGSRLAPGGRACFAVPGGAPGDFGGVNILPVFADGPGFGTLHSSADAPGSTSNVNYGIGTFDPNFAIAAFGADSEMCFTNGAISAVDVVIDSQVIAAAAAFAEPTSDGSVRLVDTRIARV